MQYTCSMQYITSAEWGLSATQSSVESTSALWVFTVLIDFDINKDVYKMPFYNPQEVTDDSNM